MTEKLKFSIANKDVIIEDQFMIEIIYHILRREFGNPIYYSEKIAFSKDEHGCDEFENFYCNFRTILGCLELLLKNLGERIVPIFAVEYYIPHVDELLDYLCFMLVVNYGSTKTELIEGVWKYFSDFYELYLNLQELEMLNDEPVIFHNIKLIHQFY